MASGFSKIYGNDHLKHIFSENICNRTLPHAFILEGGKGSGRYSFALHIAAMALCTDMDPVCYCCKNCRQIFEGTAPDVVTVSLPEDKATVSVDSVRFVRSDAQSVPVEGELKFYIIRDSDKMTVQAQNALLKILEEPPSFVVFILISESSNLLLPTIRSRAPVYRMHRFDDAQLNEYLISCCNDAVKLSNSDPQIYARILKSSNGCIGAALNGLRGATHKSAVRDIETVNGMLDSLCGSSRSRFLAYEDEFSSKRDEFKNYLSIIRSAVRDILSVKKGSVDELMFFDGVDKPKKYAKVLTLSALVDLLETTDNTLNSNEMNANINLLKINYMNSLWKCVH